MEKRGAMEMSVGTIVVIVLALTMLILGLVLVRTIMCGAVGLTADLNSRVKGEVSKLFEATGGEVQCVGNAGEPVTMNPGKTNIVFCGIRAPISKKYVITTLIPADVRGDERAQLKEWLGGKEEVDWEGEVAPGDELPKKVARLDIPDNAPEITVRLQVVAREKGKTEVISTQDLDFKISRQGLIKAAVC